MGSFPIGDYRIPIKLKARCRTCINQILQYTDWNQEAENDYIRCLQAEELMEKHFPNELQQFKKKYQPNKPQNAGLQTPLYAVIIKRRTSKAFAEALYEYNYLFCLSEEYYRIIQPKPNLSSTVVVTRQSSVPTANFSNTIHGYGEQQNRKTDGGLDAKFLREENERLKKLVEDQGEEIKRLNNQRKENAQTIDELRNRLSGFASKKLTEGNPNFTDLSDKNRPTKIGEKFHAVYDDEWTNSLEVLTKKDRMGDEEAIHCLAQLIEEIYKYCSGLVTEQRTHIMMTLVNPGIISPQQLAKSADNIPVVPGIDRKILDLQRDLWSYALPNVQKGFKASNKFFQKYSKYAEVEKYVDSCIEIVWLMRITDPPMVLKWPHRGEQLDTNLYSPYHNKGSTVSYSVWPAILLHEGGPVINKGFAKPMLH